MHHKAYDIIIVGAGAAGLMAARELLSKGYTVCLLEASAAAGGRIATIRDNRFDQAVDAGAEFIHGDLPLTLQLLREAGIGYERVGGRMVSVKKGRWDENEDQDRHWQKAMQVLAALQRDQTIAEFLNDHFGGDEYRSLRRAFQKYAEGFDLADISTASALGIQKEWLHESGVQYRIPGGYIKLVQYLLAPGLEKNADIYFDSCVQEVDHTNKEVTVTTVNGESFTASKVIITVSAGVLQSDEILFVPALAEHALAIKQLGFGTVIKILLQFSTFFWEKRSDDIGFILSNEEIPTWWTQAPAKSGILTGWLGGPAARSKAQESETDILNSSLRSLSAIFGLPVDYLQQQLVHHKIICWDHHSFVKGGYSFDTIHSVAAKKTLSRPVSGCVFFAGEAIHAGDSPGTVEAALQSGLAVAKQITWERDATNSPDPGSEKLSRPQKRKIEEKNVQ